MTEPNAAAAPLTQYDMPVVLEAALSRFEELRTPLFDPTSAFSINVCPAGGVHNGKLEILFSAQPAHRDALLGRLRKGLAAAGYDAWPQDVPGLVGSGTLSILVSHSPDAERMRAAAMGEVIDALTRCAGLAVHDFLSEYRSDLGLCTAAARDRLLVRFVVAYLVSAGLVKPASAGPPGWLALGLEEVYASAMAGAVAEAVEQRARFDAAARAMPTEKRPSEIEGERSDD